MGGSIVMKLPKIGWFLFGKIPSFEMDDDLRDPVMTKRTPPFRGKDETSPPQSQFAKILREWLTKQDKRIGIWSHVRTLRCGIQIIKNQQNAWWNEETMHEPSTKPLRSSVWFTPLLAELTDCRTTLRSSAFRIIVTGVIPLSEPGSGSFSVVKKKVSTCVSRVVHCCSLHQVTHISVSCPLASRAQFGMGETDRPPETELGAWE